MSIFDWSTTALTNGSADATINWQEGQAPSTVNDSARAMMARLAFFRNWSAGNMTQGGSSNAYTITSGESLSAYNNGMRFLWKPNGNSTGAVTLNVDSIGAKKVYLPSGSQAGSGDISANAVYDVVYQSALDSSNGGFKIVGSQVSLGANLTAIQGLATTDGGFIVGNGSTFVLETGATAQASLGYTASDVLSKLITVDGAGSGLDADTLDGVQGSAYATLAASNTFTNRQIVDRSAASAPGNLTIRGAGTGFVRSSITLETADTSRGAGLFIWDDTSDVEFFFGLRYNHVSGDALSILRRTSVTSGSTDSATADAATATEIARFASNGMTAKVAPSSETSGTLTRASANRTIQATGDITINNSVFSAGDIILIYAGASARNITQGSGVTMRLAGTTTTGTRTLAARGVAVLFFVSASEVIVGGNGVT